MPSRHPAPEPSPARRRRKEARPPELLQAALELFVAKGFAATRSEEVAARAAVSKGTLYRYFPSKAELFKAVVRQNLSTLIAEGQQLADRFEGPSDELLRRLLRSWWTRFGSTAAGGIFKIIVAEVRNFPELAQFYVDEVQVPADRLIAGTLQRAIRRGEFRAVPVAEATLALIAPMLFLALHRHSVGACPAAAKGMDPLAVLDTHLALVLDGLRPPTAAATRAAPATRAGRATPPPPRRRAARPTPAMRTG
jgi:AcrR family transcriptional regulator